MALGSLSARLSMGLADLVPRERNSSSSWEALENSVVAVAMWQCGRRTHFGAACDPGQEDLDSNLGLTSDQLHEPLLQDSGFHLETGLTCPASSWGAENP
ncbi:hypothetical protein H1C71_033023 [Ictidomys tridecemlineatus]|nr:hypothetical protein H1C71_033023 [Ictidomys tridecemlineatus]